MEEIKNQLERLRTLREETNSLADNLCKEINEIFKSVRIYVEEYDSDTIVTGIYYNYEDGKFYAVL